MHRTLLRLTQRIFAEEYSDIFKRLLGLDEIIFQLEDESICFLGFNDGRKVTVCEVYISPECATIINVCGRCAWTWATKRFDSKLRKALNNGIVEIIMDGFGRWLVTGVERKFKSKNTIAVEIDHTCDAYLDITFNYDDKRKKVIVSVKNRRFIYSILQRDLIDKIAKDIIPVVKRVKLHYEVFKFWL